MKAKDLIEVAYKKYLKSGEYHVNEGSLKYEILVNELKDKFVFSSNEIDILIDGALELIEIELKLQLEKQGIGVKIYGKRH